MAKFVYKMQNILNIKQSMENQAKTYYSQAADKLKHEEDQLRELLRHRLDYESECRKLSMNKLDISAIVKCNHAIEVIKESIKKQILSVKIAERNLDSARNRLNEAIKERKTHDKLKDKSFQEFIYQINSDEKKEIDELVSFVYNDNNRETGEQ